MTDITELAQRMKAAAEKASNGDWVKESGDGWEACCSANDQANGGFIIAHFEGPDAAENREFVQAANPANILALVEALEKAQAQSSKWLEAYHKAVSIGARYEERIAGLESRTVKLPPKVDSSNIPFAGHTWNCCLDEVEKRLAAAGIKVEAE
ncbi:TPA: ead/Ea22-like family protein [Klebsiella pneumoniae]|uniref:ead/Ea22-like family protein n=1 Tax=Klebsiella pneumoniae TaxID=573 RepID=UPI002440FC91|nr:ead/Ea22-like family protein [Klebsiella pneumoniae]HBQ1879831.1 ead/Ea22-like family protein [Klebsiella pneumoniae]